MFILLQNGLYLDNLSLPNIKVSKLYIKWDEKISVVAKELNITKNKNSKTTYDKSIKNIKRTMLFSGWFELIQIEKISFNDLKGSFFYKNSEQGHLHLSSPNFSLESSLYSKSDLLKIDINKLKIKEKKVDVAGELFLILGNDLKLESSLNITINDDANITLNITADENKLSYNLVSNKDIKYTKYIIDLFDINPKAKYWFYDAMTLSSLSIKSVDGWIEYKNIEKAYLNLHAKAVANDLIYTYDKKVASVRTTHTNLEFVDGVLFIRPQNAYSYDFFLNKSWLKIDFSKKEELLTLHLLFKGQANKDLLSLLNRYEIKLPFIQTKGELDTNLNLVINLRSNDVNAVGNFYTKKAQINYLGLDLDIFNAHVFLKNTNVKVDNMFAKYKDIASSHVDLNFNAKNHKGRLDFRANKISLKTSNLELKKETKPLNISYIISPKQDHIEVDKSTWNFNRKILYVNAIKIPFNMKTLTAKLPLTTLNIPKTAFAKVSGKILFKPTKVDLNIDLLKFNHNNIKLKQSKLPIKLLYDKKLKISTKDTIKLDIYNRKYKLSNVAFNIKNNMFNVKNIKLDSGDMLKSRISAEYNLKKSKGHIDLHKIDFKYEKLGEIFKSSKNIKFDISKEDNITQISSKEYDLNYRLTSDKWLLEFNSVKKFIKNSKIFKEYNFDNGYLSIYKDINKKNIEFLANTEYKYKVLSTINKPIDIYTIKGEVDKSKNNIFLNINNSVDVVVSDDIKIKANDVGININEIIDMVVDKNNTQKIQKKKDVYLRAKNCFIYLSENRRVISDDIELKYSNGVLESNLKHKEGEAEFELKDNKLYFFGKNFGDKFIEKLFALSKFKGGNMSFSIIGAPKKYNGVIHVTDTIIKDYKVLNNVLAFVNTVPSLVTFSLPGYNKNGLAAKQAYIHFDLKDDVYTMSDIFLQSKEIDIAGKGEASLINNTIDIELNLKTDLGSAISKIPLVGYILMGKENVSTSLIVKGALDNPNVNTQVAKSIIVAPFNIIKRTLLLPFKLFKSDDK
jgi:hypothetical protein